MTEFLWFTYSVGLAFFTAVGVSASRDLVEGKAGCRMKLPGWLADALCTLAIMLWPIALTAGLIMRARDQRK